MFILSPLDNSITSIFVPNLESGRTNDLRVANNAPVSLKDLGNNSGATLLIYNGKYL